MNSFVMGIVGGCLSAAAPPVVELMLHQSLIKDPGPCQFVYIVRLLLCCRGIFDGEA